MSLFSPCRATTNTVISAMKDGSPTSELPQVTIFKSVLISFLSGYSSQAQKAHINVAHSTAMCGQLSIILNNDGTIYLSLPLSTSTWACPLHQMINLARHSLSPECGGFFSCVSALTT